MGAAAIVRAREKHDDCNHTYDFSGEDVRLVIFVLVETSGALHIKGAHVAAKEQHNPGLKLSNILKTLSVAVQSARAKCIITAKNCLTLDVAPVVPFVNGPLPVTPPVTYNFTRVSLVVYIPVLPSVKRF